MSLLFEPRADAVALCLGASSRHQPRHPHVLLCNKRHLQRKNSENRMHSQACLSFAEVHPVFAGTAIHRSAALH